MACNFQTPNSKGLVVLGGYRQQILDQRVSKINTKLNQRIKCIATETGASYHPTPDTTLTNPVNNPPTEPSPKMMEKAPSSLFFAKPPQDLPTGEPTLPGKACLDQIVLKNSNSQA